MSEMQRQGQQIRHQFLLSPSKPRQADKAGELHWREGRTGNGEVCVRGKGRIGLSITRRGDTDVAYKGLSRSEVRLPITWAAFADALGPLDQVGPVSHERFLEAPSKCSTPLFFGSVFIRLSMIPTMPTWTSLRCGSPKSLFRSRVGFPFGVADFDQAGSLLQGPSWDQGGTTRGSMGYRRLRGAEDNREKAREMPSPDVPLLYIDPACKR